MARPKSEKKQISVGSKNSPNSVGERLRRAREEKGISLEEAHRVTKIHPRVLESIEEDRLENILGKAYVKSFVKNYAHYLGLDAAQIAEQYVSGHFPEAGEKPILEKRPISQRRDRKFSHTLIVASVFIVWFVILSFATIKFINHYKNLKQDKEIIASKVVEPEEKTLSPAEDINKELIPIPQNRNITLTVISYRDVWIKVVQDGKLAFHGTLSEDSRETWRANNEIRLSEIGRPEALKFIVNGKDINFPRKRLGKNILITRKGIDLEPK